MVAIAILIVALLAAGSALGTEKCSSDIGYHCGNLCHGAVDAPEDMGYECGVLPVIVLQHTRKVSFCGCIQDSPDPKKVTLYNKNHLPTGVPCSADHWAQCKHWCGDILEGTGEDCILAPPGVRQHEQFEITMDLFGYQRLWIRGHVQDSRGPAAAANANSNKYNLFCACNHR